PDNSDYNGMLAAAQKRVGLIVRGGRNEAEADPPQACIAFSVPPARRDDFNAQDWVRLDPPVPGAAVTRQKDEICVAGLPSGRSTDVILRAGLPGEGGMSLTHEATLAVAMPDRAPAIIVDSSLFVLPRGQAPALNVTTVNLSSLTLRLMRLSERSTVAFLRDNRLGSAIESYAGDQIADTLGNVVWEGTADVPNWQRNVPAHIALPIPDALLHAGPGLYALQLGAGDGTPDVNGATQMILRTDLAPTVWRGADGLTVQLRGYADAQVRPGVKLQLLAHNNDVLAEATSDGDGVARFAKALLRGDGPLAPAVLHAFAPDGDFAALQLDTASFDLSDRGVTGSAQPGPLDAYVWLDRGIYRPGETVQVMAMLRDAAGQPVDFPARVTIRRPNGVVFLQANPARQADASIYLPVQLSAGAPAGMWQVEVRADPDAPPVGTAEFRVDAFVPDRMAVDIGPVLPLLIPGQTAALPVTARFLYGAPGANLSGDANLTIEVDPAPFPALAGWRIGLADEAFAPDHRDLQMADTDAQGRTSVPLRLDDVPDTTRPLKADIQVEVNDPSGHAARATAVVPIRGRNPFIAIKPAFEDGSVDAGAEAAFDVVAVQPDGTRMAMPAQV
ncbi:MAG TPA: MG2 domain-containing protein, partial [Acetobacteraceae bacterium]|nr:MG2 domain-containing protein [Acetobacteraceae bacterium]